MPMRLGTPLPSLEGATHAFHAEGFRPEELAGHPVLVHFWSVSCAICHEVMPDLVAWRDRYSPRGLRVVGVHQPKEEGDLDLEKVRRDIAAFGLHHPILVDGQLQIADSFQNQFVPAFYLFAPDGTLFFRAAGGKGLQNLEPKLEQLLGAAGDEARAQPAEGRA